MAPNRRLPLRELVTKRDAEPIPRDVAVVAVVVGGLGAIQLLLALAALVAAPAPQHTAAAVFAVPGTVLLLLGLATYQRRPIGWIGLLSIGVVGLGYDLLFDLSASLSGGLSIAALLLLVGYLSHRRAAFFG